MGNRTVKNEIKIKKITFLEKTNVYTVPIYEITGQLQYKSYIVVKK